MKALGIDQTAPTWTAWVADVDEPPRVGVAVVGHDLFERHR